MDQTLIVGETYKLYDLIGTRYMTTYTTKLLKELFNKCKQLWEEFEDKVTIDIAKCKFNPDNHQYVPRYCKYINFIDTDNPVIDSMLVHNSRVERIRELEKDNLILVETIPHKFDLEEMLGYVKNLDKSKVYRLPSDGELGGQSVNMSILISMAVGYLYPDVSVDISDQIVNYFNMFKKMWMYTGLVKRDSYYILWKNNILKVDAVDLDASGNNLFYVPGLGRISEDNLNYNYSTIPFEFGNKDLTGDSELEDIFDFICEEMEVEYKKTKRKKKKLTSELTVNGRS